MIECQGPCGLSLAHHHLFKCDHCGLNFCFIDLKKHALWLTFTYRTIPQMAKARS